MDWLGTVSTHARRPEGNHDFLAYIRKGTTIALIKQGGTWRGRYLYDKILWAGSNTCPHTTFDASQRYVVSRTGIRWLWYLGEPGFESRALNLSHTYLVNMCIIATRKPVQIYLSNAKGSVWDIRVLLAISAEG